MNPRIKALQDELNSRFAGRKFSSLSAEEQLACCRKRHELAFLAFAEYQKLKQDPKTALAAAELLIISYNLCYKEAELHSASNNKTSDTHHHVDKTEAAETLFYKGICHLVGIGDYVQSNQIAYEYFVAAAEQYNRSAMYFAGWVHSEGKIIGSKNEIAFKWYLIAAERGDANAQRMLSWWYEVGRYVDKDARKAVKWQSDAAEQGHADAQDSIGQMHSRGFSELEKNEAEAVKWYRFAAEQGWYNGRQNLARSYAEGRGIDKDEWLAAKWYYLLAVEDSYGPKLILSDKTTLAKKYYYALLMEDIAAFSALLREHMEVTEKMLLNMEEPLTVYNVFVFEKEQAMLAELDLKSFSDHHRYLINKIFIQMALTYSQYIALNDSQSIDALIKLVALLQKVDFSEIPTDKIKPLLQLLMDHWYAVTNVGLYNEADKLVTWLTKLLHKMCAASATEMDVYTMKQCLSVITQYRIDAAYTVNISQSATIADLLLLFALLESNKEFSITKINEIMGGEYLVKARLLSSVTETGFFAGKEHTAVDVVRIRFAPGAAGNH